MGFLSDALAFESFFAKDLWDGIRKQPTRLLTGVDPISTSAWNTVLGRDDKALVNQLGGAPSRTYENAEAAGINTGPGRTMHGIAQTVAGAYGAAGVGGAFGLGTGGGGAGSAQGAQPGLWDKAFSGTTGFGGAPYNANPAAGIGGIAGPVGGGTGAGASAGLSGMDYAKLGIQAANQMQPQQQPGQQMPAQPSRQANMAQPTPVPTYGQRIAGGLGRVSEALFPVDPNTGMTKQQIDALRAQAWTRAGLGMMAASGRGAGLGESLARGYGLGQGVIEQGYDRAKDARTEQRALDREKRLDEQDQWMREHQTQRALITDARQLADFDYRSEQDKSAQERWKTEQESTKAWREQQARIQREQIAATAGRSEATADSARRRAVQSLRKEFEGMDAVKNYRTVEPIIASAKKAPDNGYGDMDLIYAVGKILDPGSVVREGELALTIAAGSPMQRLIGTTRFSIEKGGRLTPQARKQIIGMLEGRVGALEDSYTRERQRFATYATENGFDPSSVVGLDGGAYGTPTPQQAPPEALEYLRQNPDTAGFFREQFGYLPPGYQE